MTLNHDLLLRLLQACAQTAPAPVFPARYAAETGTDRSLLDAAIDRLRVAGYIQIADWVQGQGQGYALTPAGTVALQQPDPFAKPPPPAEVAEQPTLRTATWDRGETIRGALLDPAPPIVTMVLIFANVAMFCVGLVLALMHQIPLNDFLVGSSLGALNDSLGAVWTPRVILQDQWWRLLSYQFLHRGLPHLGMNMLSLYMLGPFLEAIWGSKRYLVLYVVSGFVGGAAVVLAGRAAVGASGAISGLLTSVGVWLWLNRDCLPPHIVSHMMSRVGANLVLLVIVSTVPGVSWEGHLGGAVGGALISIPLQYQRFGRAWQRLLSWLALLAIPLASVAAAYWVQLAHFDRLNPPMRARPTAANSASASRHG